MMKNAKAEKKVLTNWAIYPRLDGLNYACWLRYIIEDRKTKTEIKYKIHVCSFPGETEGTMLCLFNRISDVYINNRLPDLCLDELAYETGKVFYPMVVEVDKKAEWITLRNYEQIKNKWKTSIRPDIELRFGGDISQRYLANMDGVINDKTQIESIFRNDIVFKFCFGTFYHSYSSGFEIERIIRLPLDGNNSSLFRTTCRLDQTLTDQGYKRITQYGNSLEEQNSEQQTLIEDGLIAYNAEILLTADANHLVEAKAEWQFRNDDKKIKLIFFPTRRQHKEDVDIRIDKVDKNNGSFFSFLGK